MALHCTKCFVVINRNTYGRGLKERQTQRLITNILIKRKRNLQQFGKKKKSKRLFYGGYSINKAMVAAKGKQKGCIAERKRDVYLLKQGHWASRMENKKMQKQS